MEWTSSYSVLFPAVVAFIVYINTLSADFAYDDSRAILKNQDLLPETPWTNLLFDDFWGTPLTHSGSHKSYRPLCVATFRINYLLCGHSPFGYHLVNIMLHSIVTGLFVYVVRTTLCVVDRCASADDGSQYDVIANAEGRRSAVAVMAGLLFAVHPIHTEAVAGIVGRADVLACLFFLLSFRSYAIYCHFRDQPLSDHYEKCRLARSQSPPSRNGHANGGVVCGATSSTSTRSSSELAAVVEVKRRRQMTAEMVCDSSSSSCRWLYAAGCVVFTAASMLSKEHGVTVLAVCLVYDIFVVRHLRFVDLPFVYKRQYRGLQEGIVVLLSAAVLLVGGRVLFMGCRAPEFSPSDNPASDSQSLMTRSLTFLFLPAFNGWLLLCPSTLSFDWSMGSIPLVETVTDRRNAVSVAFYTALVAIGFRIARQVDSANFRTNLRRHFIEGRYNAVRFRSKSRSPVAANGNGTHHMNGGHCQKPENGHSPADFYNSQLASVGYTKAAFRSVATSNGYRNGTGNGNGHQPYLSSSAAVHDAASPYSSADLPTQWKNGITNRCSDEAVIAQSQLRFDYNDIVTTTSLQLPDICHVNLVSLAFLVIPFFPATNLFFYVGFVVAERVLYIPSLGLCLLVAAGVRRLHQVTGKGSSPAKCQSQPPALTKQRTILVMFVAVVIAFSARTWIRNYDWLTEETLYKSGISVNPAKAWGNLANVLNAQGKSHEAERAYKAALGYRSNMADVHYNLGILYQEQGRYNDAIQSYKLAIQCRPRLTMAYLNLGIVYAMVGMKSEAEHIYRTCAEIDISGLKDPRLHEQTKISSLYNLGRLLDDQGRHQEAVAVYLEAVDKLPGHYAPQSLYNMLGEAYSKLSDLVSAERWYRLALKAKPDHIPAHLTLAKLYQRQGLHDKAEQLFVKAQQIDSRDATVYQHYGQFLADIGRHLEAAASYVTAAELAPTDFELIFNTASALRQAGRSSQAEAYYQKAVYLRPETALAHMNLGAMLHFNGKLVEAEASYLTALRLQPNDEVTTANLNKLRNKLKAIRNAAGIT